MRHIDASVNVDTSIAEVVFEVTLSTGREEELGLGFLSTTRLDNEEGTSTTAVRPFSVGFGLTMSYRASFASEPEDLMFMPEDEVVIFSASRVGSPLQAQAD
jgi:hypothetical protein